ncbi:RNA recognition family protein [Cryptosporidium andersoni]|uniref:RNA recognition family protein n=1 Tax=Cryptosporidium andersoni TaxID=117008 RepID=A0A1J4MPM7_9CRYT|nr:RNA recognition family protein [Cryptosporidium andersoni]
MPGNSRGYRDPRRSLLIRSLRFETPPSLVRRVFERFGQIRDVYLPVDFHTRRPRGFGFVEYVEESDALAAIQRMNGANLDGSQIHVTFAQEGRKSPESMRHRDNENYYTRRSTDSRYNSSHYRFDPYRRHSSYRSRDFHYSRRSKSPYIRDDRRCSDRKYDYRRIDDRRKYSDNYRSGDHYLRREEERSVETDSDISHWKSSNRENTSTETRDISSEVNYDNVRSYSPVNRRCVSASHSESPVN